MLDIKHIRQNPDQYKADLARKGVEGSVVDELLEVDVIRREMTQKVETQKARQNEVSKKIPTLSGSEKDALLDEMKVLASEKKKDEQVLEESNVKFTQLLESLPNPPLAQVPDGKDDMDNVVLEKVGDVPSFDFEIRDHVEIGKMTDTIDIASAAEKTSGARFYFLKNELPILEYALQRWAWDKLREKGYTPLTTPMMIRGEAFAKARKKAGGIDRVNEGSEFFRLADDPLFLIGTAEHITLNMHAGETFKEKEGEPFAKKYAAWSSCFRREAGAAGKDTHGILRVHQFEKMEMLVFCAPEDSESMHQELVDNQKAFFTELGIPFQVVECCTGDMGFSDSRQFDLEAWIPSQNAYREVTSASNCLDFQTRALNVKINRLNGDRVFAHSLNATGISMTRALIAILENYQNADGSVDVPEVLRPYCGFDRIEVR